MNVSIYALIDPRDGHIRYVGATSKPLEARVDEHLAGRARSPHLLRCQWFTDLWQRGLRPQPLVLETVSASEWRSAEHEWIRDLRSAGADLTNVHGGGSGGNHNTGRRLTAETRARMSASRTGKPPVRRKAVSEQARENMSRAARTSLAAAANRAKAHAAVRGKPKSAEHRAKLSAAQKGRQFTAEHRANISAAAKARARRKQVTA